MTISVTNHKQLVVDNILCGYTKPDVIVIVETTKLMKNCNLFIHKENIYFFLRNN